MVGVGAVGVGVVDTDGAGSDTTGSGMLDTVWAGIHFGGMTLTVRRTVIGGVDGSEGFGSSITFDSGALVLEDSLINLGTRTSAVGVNGANSNNGTTPIGVTVRRSTILGTGGNQRALMVQSDNAREVLTLDVDGSAFHLTGSNVDVRCTFLNAGVIASAQIRNTAFSGDVFSSHNDCGVTQSGTVDLTGVTRAQLFRAPDAADWRPIWSSPLVDRGNVGITTGIDLRGTARVIDGDGDGTAQHDIGAYEYAATAPIAVASASTPSITAGESVTFTATAADLVDDEAVTITGWTFGDGSSSVDAAPKHTYATAGTYTARVTVTDAAGTTGTDTVDVTVTDPAPTPGSGTGTGPGAGTTDTPTTPTNSATPNTSQPNTVTPPITSAADRTAPTLVVRRAVRAMRRDAKGLRFAKHSTSTLDLVLSEKSTLRLVIARRDGRRFVPVRGQQTVVAPAGTRSLAWGGRWAGRVLPSGTYRVTVIAVDAAGNSSTTRSTLVTLAAPR